MNKSIVRIILGLGVIAFGIAALLGSLNVINFSDFFHDWWPLIVVIMGILIFIGNPRNFLWPLSVVAAGVLLQLRQLDIVDFNIWQLFWPIVIICIGLSILINRTANHSNASKKDVDSISAVFSGNTTKSQADNYKGGDLTAVFGGVELDLRDATIKDEATINVFALCGGIEIKVPKNWTVRSTVTPIMGGVENKTTADKSSHNPVLVISGDVIMGGVEIKQ
jgi:predicted membrane protein